MDKARTSHRAEKGINLEAKGPSWNKARDKFTYVTRALSIAWTAASGWTIAWLMLLLLQGFVPAATVYFTKLLVDTVSDAVGGGMNWSNLTPVLYPASAMGTLLLLGQVLQNAVVWVRAAQAELVTDHIKELIHRKTAAIDLEFYDIPAYFDHMSRANEEADRRVLSILENTGMLAQNLITLLAIAGILLPYGWWVPFVLIGSTLPALGIIVRHQGIYHKWWRKVTPHRRWARYYDDVITQRASAQEVRLFGLSELFRLRYQDIRKRLRTSHIRLLRDQRVAAMGAGLLALAATVAIIGWMVTRAFKGLATLGDIALFYQAFIQGQNLMRTLLGSIGVLYSDALFLEHLFTFLELEPRVKAPPQPRSAPLSLQDGITVDGVTFRYPGSENVALHDFSLFIPAGKTVAIVGKNGAGKSTLIKLLCRFYDADAGHVRWDGIDIRDFDPLDLWKRITVLFQYPVNYAGPVKEVIGYGDVSSSEAADRLAYAASAAEADEIVDRLPDKFDTLLGKQFLGGVDLSGGEWQRVALARAFYRDAPVILLDEPTSFMDSWAEMQWLDRFRSLVKGRTALIVTHRFTTAMRADIIYVMDAGQIVESGTHEELLSKNGTYADSWHMQVQAEREQTHTS